MISENRIKEICDLYYRDVYRYCFSYVQNVEDSQDITQETFAFLIEKANELEDKNIKAWLYSVALIKIKQNYNNKDTRIQHLSFDDSESGFLFSENDVYTIEDTISNYIYNSERIEEEKNKILESLSPKERNLYDEVYVKKRKHKEVAEDNGVSDVTIGVQAFRLRNKIKTIIKGIFDFCFMFLI